MLPTQIFHDAFAQTTLLDAILFSFSRVSASSTKAGTFLGGTYFLSFLSPSFNSSSSSSSPLSSSELRVSLRADKLGLKLRGSSAESCPLSATLIDLSIWYFNFFSMGLIFSRIVRSSHILSIPLLSMMDFPEHFFNINNVKLLR